LVVDAALPLLLLPEIAGRHRHSGAPAWQLQACCDPKLGSSSRSSKSV
jgi:hypothetical protein